MTLERYINENIKEDERSIFYNEEFCNLTLDYIASYVGGIEDFKEVDTKYLNSKGYEPTDFYEYD